jgi:hypothetical protein
VGEQGEEFPQLTAEDAQRRARAARWDQCERDGCIGVVAGEGKCLVHLGAQQAVDRFRRGYPVDVSGCDVPKDWLRDLTASGGAMPALGFVAKHSRFAEDADFRDITFREDSSFSDANFGDGARFDEATFAAPIGFDNARFGEAASFVDAEFGAASFQAARFGTGTGFDGAQFSDRANFSEAGFGSSTGFWGVRFEAGVNFVQARFGEGTAFQNAKFGENSAFWDSSFGPGTSFADAHFGEVRWGVIFCAGLVGFQRIVTEKRFELIWVKPIEADESPRVSFDGARFGDAFVLRGQGEVSLKSVDVRAASIVAPAASQIAQLRARHQRLDEDLPLSVTSLASSHVTELTLEDVILDNCKFSGAVGLSSLSLEGSITFLRTSRWWETHRAQLAEELAREEIQLSHETLEGIYRSLRKAKEDSGDYPGGSDFHYGHMLMRTRRAKGAERLILEPFRLVGGYGVRAWRAFVAFAVVVLAFAVLLQGTGGLTCPAPAKDVAPTCATGFPAAVEVSVQSATSLGHDLDSSQLSGGGFYLMLTLRILGPALLAMGFLALRARVRR